MNLKTKTLFISLISVGIINAQTLRYAQTLQKDLINAILEENVEKVRDLIKEGARVNAKRGTQPIIAATKMGIIATTTKNDSKMATITKELLRNKANPSVQDMFGMTPLMWTAKNGANRILKVLLGNKEARATINMQDRNGDTALIQATKATTLPRKYLATARALLKKGANSNVKNKKGKSALFYAEESGNTRMVRLLHRHGAKRPVSKPRLQQKPIGKYTRPPMTTMPVLHPRYEIK